MTPLMWWILGLRAGAAEVAPGTSSGGRDDVVAEGEGWLEDGERGWEVVAAPLLVPTSSAATAAGEAGAVGKSTDWIRKTNMAAGLAGLLGPFPFFLAVLLFISDFLPPNKFDLRIVV